MILLGLHFGHDAAATVLRDGTIDSYVLRERVSRVKHALGLDMQVIGLALNRAGIDLSDIDCIALSSTQCVELIADDQKRIGIRYTLADNFDRPMTALGRFAGLDHDAIAATNTCTFLDYVFDEQLAHTHTAAGYRAAFPACHDHLRTELNSVPWIDTFHVDDRWQLPIRLDELGSLAPEISEQSRYGFHLPVEVRIDDHIIPGYAIHHHLAHAATSYYLSGFDRAAIMTHDGFGLFPGYHSGMFYLGDDEALYPLYPHHLTAGYLYEYVATELGLGAVGGSGKLMGLAAYGVPRFFNPRFVGNIFDFAESFQDISGDWVAYCKRAADALGYDLSQFGQPASAMAEINVDIAASTQRLFEVTRLRAVHALDRQLTNIKENIRNLCLSGGTALNCPSNTEIAASGPFDQIFIDPACDDSGISTGAALAAYHSILGYPRADVVPTPYLGPLYQTSAIDAALSHFEEEVVAEQCENPGKRAAEDLSADLIIGWFEGGSECGPRALGHRSILADPRNGDNWSRVNSIKGREFWRPLAPAVLEEEAPMWFSSVPLPSPYMLFNGSVISDLLPAVTHVDHTARVQTVNASSGNFFEVIRSFAAITNIPVVLNTSLNGPGEPIAETPEDALNVFVSRRLDVLYLDGWRVVRRSEGC